MQQRGKTLSLLHSTQNVHTKITMADDQDVLTILNRNDPEVTDILICLYKIESPDARRAIGEALAQNPHVELVTLVFTYGFDYDEDFTRLGEELETRRKLECVNLLGWGISHDSRFRTSAPILRRLLNSVRQNPHIEIIQLVRLDITGQDLFRFRAEGLHLSLDRVRIAPSEISTVTAALREQSLEAAGLEGLDDELWMPLMSSLCKRPDPVSWLTLMHQTESENFRPLASFNPNALLQAAAAFHHRKLSFHCFPVAGPNFDALIDIIPYLRADTLAFVFYGQFESFCDQIRVKRRLLTALKKNYTFLRADLAYYSDPNREEDFSLLNEVDEERVNAFSARNRRLRVFVENPDTVPPELWTAALYMASKAGLHAHFDSCCSVLPKMFSKDDKDKGDDKN